MEGRPAVPGAGEVYAAVGASRGLHSRGTLSALCPGKQRLAFCGPSALLCTRGQRVGRAAASAVEALLPRFSAVWRRCCDGANPRLPELCGCHTDATAGAWRQECRQGAGASASLRPRPPPPRLHLIRAPACRVRATFNLRFFPGGPVSKDHQAAGWDFSLRIQGNTVQSTTVG